MKLCRLCVTDDSYTGLVWSKSEYLGNSRAPGPLPSKAAAGRGVASCRPGLPDIRPPIQHGGGSGAEHSSTRHLFSRVYGALQALGLLVNPSQSPALAKPTPSDLELVICVNSDVLCLALHLLTIDKAAKDLTRQYKQQWRRAGRIKCSRLLKLNSPLLYCFFFNDFLE